MRCYLISLTQSNFCKFDNKKHVTITSEEGTIYTWSLGKMLQISGKLEDVHIPWTRNSTTRSVTPKTVTYGHKETCTKTY